MKTFPWIPSVGLTYFYHDVTKICVRIRLGINSLALFELENQSTLID